MKRLVLIIVCVLSFQCSFAGDNYSAVRTSVDNGRYEIVQSEMMRKLVFLLDKYTGDVYQNVLTSDNERAWRKLNKAGVSYDSTPQTQINYQLFAGGFSVQDIFLLNINTGETWYIYQDKKKDMLFFSKSLANSDI